MKTQTLGFLAALATALAAVAICRADPPGELQFEDRFDSLDPTWGESSDVFSVKDGVAVIRAVQGKGDPELQLGNVYDDADISVRVRRTTDGKDLGKASGGLLFWSTGYANYYLFEVRPDGTYDVARWFKDRWLFPISRRKCEPLNKGVGIWNQLRVVTKENQATVYVNDKELLTFKGQPPESGGSIGIRAESDNDQVVSWEFDDLLVK